MANFIAIDLETNGVYAVFGEARGGAKVTHAVAWTTDDPEPPLALTLDTARAFGEGLRAKLRAAGGPPAPVLFAIGRDKVILKELKHPPVPPTEEPALIKFQAIKEMSESPDDVVLDYVPLGTDATGECRAMAVMLRKDLFHAIQAMCVAAGVKLAGVTPRPYAVAAGLVRAFAAGTVPPPEHKTDSFATLTLNPGGGEFTVVRNGDVVLTLALPGPVMANESMLVAQLRRNLTVYAQQHPSHPIRAVYVAEVGPGWTGRLSDSLGVPVHAYDPLAGVLPKVPDAFRGRFAGAVGLLAGKATDTLPINFASPRQPTAARDPAKKLLVLAALAATLLLAVGAGGGLFLRATAANRVDNLTQQRDELKTKIDKGKADVKRTDAVEGWSKREVVWLDELHDLADRMPADDGVRLTSFTATPLPVGKDGKQDAQARIEMKFAAPSVKPVDALASAIDHDNTTTNKYYTNSPISVIGAASGATPGSKHTLAYGLVTQVSRRPANMYDRHPTFVPPKRSWGVFTPAPVAPEPVPEPPPPVPPGEPAPPPTEK